MAKQVDVIVIGLGPGGQVAATKLAQTGLSTIGIEARLVGGECPYYGCVPSKMMVRAGNALAEGHRIQGLAGQVQSELSLPKLLFALVPRHTSSKHRTV